MTLSQPITSFGLHQATLRDKVTKEMATMMIISELSPDLGQEVIALQGGSSAYPWDSAPGYASGEISLTAKQFDLNALKYFGGLNATTPNFTEDSDGEASGNVSAITNLLGSSIANATTGLASVALTTPANAMLGDYIIKATTDDDFDVYLNNSLSGDIFVNDALKITASPLAIGDTSATVVIPNTGLTVTGGSGTVALIAGDMGAFSVRPISNYLYEYKGGGPGTALPEFELWMFTEKLGTNKYRYLYFPRVRSNGIKPSFSEKEFSTFESTLSVLNDTALGYAWKMGVINR